MPEMTPIWIDGYYESQAEAASDMKVWLQAHGIKLEGVPTPALTLDQIEEWLTAQRAIHPFIKEYEPTTMRDQIVDDLLAQVQAWRKGDGHE